MNYKLVQIFESGEEIDLPKFLERGGKVFLDAGMLPHELLCTMAQFIAYAIGNGARNANELSVGLRAISELLTFTANEVFLSRMGEPEGRA